MKLIHLSDTHVGHARCAERLMALLDDIAQRHDPAQCLIVHTGDLNDNGTEATMQQSRPLLDAMRAKGWRILLAPGNHDCGNAMMVDPGMAQRFFSHYQAYVFGDHPQQFPVLTLTPDLALIGLDSNAEEMRWWERFAAEGNLGDKQIAALNQMLDRDDVRQRKVVLYLHHHPFFDAFAVRADVGDGHLIGHLIGWNTRRFRRLKDAYSLMQCIRDRVDILLFGHQHFGLDYSTEGQRYGIPLALDASSSTCAQMDTDRMRYRVIDPSTLHFETCFVALP